MAGTNKAAAKTDQVDFHGGTVIGKDGNEVAITEEMVRNAILELDPEAFNDSGAEDQSKH
jgi:hypothetical protein